MDLDEAMAELNALRKDFTEIQRQLDTQRFFLESCAQELMEVAHECVSEGLF
jgi:hypothetical protein